jgi:acyl-CoA thioester hydrolase
VSDGSVTREPEVFTLPITVQPGDIDELGHVNNVVFVRYVQDAAVAHWRARTSAAEQAALVWVALRHEIDYRRPAFLGEELRAETWVGPASRRAFERRTRILGPGADDLRAEARTIWCPLDPKTLKPIEPGPELRARFSAPGSLER